MQNKLEDLNNIFFEMIERVTDDDLTDEEFEKEIKKANIVCNLGKVAVDNAKVQFEATRFMYDNGMIQGNSMPTMLEYGKKNIHIDQN